MWPEASVSDSAALKDEGEMEEPGVIDTWLIPFLPFGPAAQGFCLSSTLWV